MRLLSTLRCLTNVRRTFINFKDFSHQYLFIRDRMFIKFESMISQTKSTTYFLQKKSVYQIFITFFPSRLFFGPIRLLIFQNFPPPTFIRTRTSIRHLRVDDRATINQDPFSIKNVIWQIFYQFTIVIYQRSILVIQNKILNSIALIFSIQTLFL